MTIDPRRIELMDDHVAEIMRRKSADERLTMAHQMWRQVRYVVADAIRSQHPHWTPSEVIHELARRMSGGAI